MLRNGTACGSGLGSSYMVQMNIESILRDLGVSVVLVELYVLGGDNPIVGDVLFVGLVVADSETHLGDVRLLNSIIDM
ncbi:PTS lactose transporter subunit IIB, partial [Streptococcus suis]